MHSLEALVVMGLHVLLQELWGTEVAANLPYLGGNISVLPGSKAMVASCEVLHIQGMPKGCSQVSTALSSPASAPTHATASNPYLTVLHLCMHQYS